jgi:D-arabinose 1-dehydrogenase-like Zn-dependent alcohol dehydrogenase
VIDDVGSGVTGWKKGQRVGIGWHAAKMALASRAAAEILPIAAI